MAIRRSKYKLRTILPKYLKGFSKKQYLTKLLSMERDLLRAVPLGNQHKVLTSTFRESDYTTLNVLEKENYTITNVYTRRHAREYTYNIFRHAYTAKIISIKQ